MADYNPTLLAMIVEQLTGDAAGRTQLVKQLIRDQLETSNDMLLDGVNEPGSVTTVTVEMLKERAIAAFDEVMGELVEQITEEIHNTRITIVKDVVFG